MRPLHRRSALRVVGGCPLRKNNWSADHGDIYARPQSDIRLERWSPGTGYRHLLGPRQLHAFIELLPECDEVAVGLEGIVLAAGSRSTMGWCDRGVVALCAWDRGLWWTDADPAWVEDNRHMLEVLEVEQAKHGPRRELRWTRQQARAFLLGDVLLHELGHHHDRMTNRSRRRSARGEPYAERYARTVFDELWRTHPEAFWLSAPG